MSGYWADTLTDELSQGDLLDGAWVGTATLPRVALEKTTGKHGVTFWKEGAFKAGEGHFLSKGRALKSIVATHSCEIDKQGSKTAVLVAPVFPMSVVQTEYQEHIRDGSRHAFKFLPAVAGVLEDSYADLRCLAFMHRPVIDTLTRRLSVTREGEAMLSAQLVAFFTRIDLASIKL